MIFGTGGRKLGFDSEANFKITLFEIDLLLNSIHLLLLLL